MKPYASTFGTTVAINLKLLLACGFGWTSWAVWPETAQWWGMGLLSVMTGIAAMTTTIEAIRLMVRVYQREKIIRDYMAIGGTPKSSEMASDEKLDKAGMR